MVAVARILNVTLVIPELDKTSYWNDPSDFGDIFDEEHFVRALAGHVRVVRALPAALQNATAFRKAPVSWSQVSAGLPNRNGRWRIAVLPATIRFTMSYGRGLRGNELGCASRLCGIRRPKIESGFLFDEVLRATERVR